MSRSSDLADLVIQDNLAYKMINQNYFKKAGKIRNFCVNKV